jgi:hypothetical protein
MFKIILLYIKGWWKRHIVDECPNELVDDEFSEKYRK